MAALGELIIILIYIILSIFVLIASIKLVRPNSLEDKRKNLIRLSIFISLLILFSYSQYKNHRSEELKKVGEYYLTQYPNCHNCILKLNEDNTYYVIGNKTIIEEGKWKYISGGDYWITEIGESGQLGNDIYKY